MAQGAVKRERGCTMPKLLAVDGNSLMHRAFHALPLLTDEQGRYTNAVFGFMGMLIRLLKEKFR